MEPAWVEHQAVATGAATAQEGDQPGQQRAFGSDEEHHRDGTATEDNDDNAQILGDRESTVAVEPREGTRSSACCIQ